MRRVADLWRGRRARWLTVGAVVVLLAAGALVRAVLAGADTAPSMPVTVVADSGVVTMDVATSGTVEPAQNRTLSFAVAGTVTRMSVQPGTRVRVGQTLATVDAGAARDAVDSATDRVTKAREALSAATKAAATPVPRTTACAGTGQAVVRPAALESAAPRTGSSAPAPSPVPSQTCSASGQNGGAQPGSTAQGSGGTDAILTAEQRLNQANEDLAEAEVDLAGTTITAPIAGTVLDVTGTVGSQVSRGATVVTIADTHTMQVKAMFPEADAGSLAVRQSATVTLADREEFEATVIQVDPSGTNDGTLVRYGIVLAFTTPPEDLLIGQSAAVRVRTGTVQNAVRVPTTAVHDVADGRGTVLLADGSTNGTRRAVQVGLRGDQYTEITSGLAAGEAVRRSW